MQMPTTELALDTIKVGEAIALIVLFVIALICLGLGGWLLRGLSKVISGDAVLYRRHWGGFGGDSSGWQVSAPLAATTLGFALIALGVSLATSMLFVLHQHEIVKPKQETSQATNQATDAASGAGAAAPGSLKPKPPVSTEKPGDEEEPARAPAAAT